MQLPSLKDLTSLFSTSGVRTFTSKPVQISPHITATMSMHVAGMPLKKNYAPDLNVLVNDKGLTLKKAAQLCNMSAGYASKVLKDFKNR